ncbi:MAG: DUF1186 domain-containing protein [Balneolaceae bacterium]
MPDTPFQENPFDFEITYDANFILEKYRISDEAADQIDEIFPEIYKGKKSTIKRLHRLCKKFPQVPQFKNYLSIAYDRAGNDQKATEINRELLQQHPGYLFARINQAEDLIANNQLEEIPGLLGEDMHIHKLYPDRDIFHIGEVSKYYSTAIQYLLKTDKADEAKLRFEYISKVEPESPEAVRSLFDIMQYNLKKNTQRHREEKLKERTVQSTGYRKDYQTNQVPTFTHPEIEALYKYGLDIPDENVQTILELPRESLIIDLERVLEDAINRYEFFYDEADDMGWNDERYNFSVHAVLLLTELRSNQSLDNILDLLRQGDDFREFWYGDYLEDIFSEPVAILAENQLEVIINFLKEPDLDAYCRNIGLSALEIVARFHDERRPEIIEKFDDLIQFHLSQLDNDRIIDTTLLSFLVWSCMNISAAELLPSIKKLFMHDLIHETMVGNLEDVEQAMKENVIDWSTQPKDIYETYEFLNRKPIWGGLPPSEDSNQENYEGQLNTKTQGSGSVQSYSTLPFGNSKEPATNPYKDVGRNDPCPCGSGKKYKKCCL